MTVDATNSLPGIHRQPMPLLSVCPIPGWHAYAVKYSPFDPNLIACVANVNYGIKGEGALLLLRRHNVGNQFQLERTFTYHDALFDVTFSENDPNLICAASACGNIIVFHLVQGIVGVVVAHSKEISSVQWNPNRNSDNFMISASWDTTTSLIDTERFLPIKSFHGHKNFVYAAVWNPRNAEIFCSASADATLAVWDLRTDRPQRGIQTSSEILTADWSYYEANTIAMGLVDNSVQLWDLRHLSVPTAVFSHQKAVRKVRFSPFFAHLVASVSYDFTTQIHNLVARRTSLVLKNHSEFAYGLDWSLTNKLELVDCGWDQRVCVFSLPSERLFVASTI